MSKQKTARVSSGYSAVIKRLRKHDMAMRRLQLQTQHIFGGHAYKLLQDDKTGTTYLHSLADDLQVMPEVLRASIRFWKLVDRQKLKQLCALDIPPKWIAMSRWSFIYNQQRRDAIMSELLAKTCAEELIYRKIADARRLEGNGLAEAEGDDEVDEDTILVGYAEPNYALAECHYRWVVIQEPGKPETRYEVGRDNVEEIYSHIDEFGCCCGPGGPEVEWIVVCYEPQSPGDDLPPQTHIDGRFCERHRAIESNVAFQLATRVRDRRHRQRNRAESEV